MAIPTKPIDAIQDSSPGVADQDRQRGEDERDEPDVHRVQRPPDAGAHQQPAGVRG